LNMVSIVGVPLSKGNGGPAALQTRAVWPRHCSALTFGLGGEAMMVLKRDLRLGRHLGVYSMCRLRHRANPPPALSICAKKQVSPEASYNPSVSPGPLCTISGCPVRLLSFPVDENDFRDATFTVSYWLVLECFEPATGIGSSVFDTRLSEDMEILPHAVVLPCVKEVATDREEKRFHADIESPASISPLSRSTRAVLCIPDCTSERCKVSNETGRLQHLCHLSRGCYFYGLEREDGYLPRVA
jgi:hypothetical protein